MGVDCASISNLVTNVRKVQADQPHLFEQAPPGFDDVGMIPRKPFGESLGPSYYIFITYHYISVIIFEFDQLR